MPAVGLDRDRAKPPASADQHDADREVHDRRRGGEGDADPEILERHRISSRTTAVHPIETAASRINPPSTPAEKYSAFSWPNRCCSSGGVLAQRSIAIATRAATRFTTDSSASDRNPTESVSCQASIFSEIVVTAAATDSQSNLPSLDRDAEATADVTAAGSLR